MEQPESYVVWQSDEVAAMGDAGYQGVEKRDENNWKKRDLARRDEALET